MKKLFDMFKFPLFGTDVIRLNENFKELNEVLSTGQSEANTNINGHHFDSVDERLISIEQALQEMGHDLPGKDVIK